MAQKASLSVIYECRDFAAINKPAGLLTHPTPASGGEKTLIDAVLARYPEVRGVGDAPEIRPGIVHRLDRDTSGILIIARNDAFFHSFKALLTGHKVEKAYRALVWGKLPQKGIIEAPIGLKSGTIRRTVHTGGQKLIKPAVTAYRALKHLSYGGEPFTYAELMPKTGRTHQLRVHMASIGHPILGDRLYGGRYVKHSVFNIPRQMLHAYALQFEVRDGEVLRLEAPLPDDFRDVLKKLGQP